MLGQLAGLHRKAGRPREARQAVDEGLAIVRDVGDRRFEGVFLVESGWLYALDGDTERARAELDRAEQTLLKAESDTERCKLFIRRAQLAEALGEDRSNWSSRAERLFEELGLDDRSELGVLMNEMRQP